MLNLNAMFNTSCDVFDTRGDDKVNNKSLDADYLLNDLSSSLNAISSQFSALMSSHNRISDMYSYIKLYGVDRACVQVYNRDGLLTDLSNGVVPATEDFRESNVSKYTIACMEGLGEAIIKIFKWCWEKLKAIGKWIGEKVVAAFNWILSLLGSDKKKEKEVAEAIEELAKVKGEAKSKIDEIIKRSNTSSSSNKITGVEDFDPYAREPKLDPYTSREWYEKKCANAVINEVRHTLDRLVNSVQFQWRNLNASIKRIDTFTNVIDSYGDAADDDSKFEEAYKRAMSETGDNYVLSRIKGRTGEDYAENKERPTWTGAWTGKTYPNKDYMDVKENMKTLAAGLKNIASNPLRFKDFNELKNSFDQHRSLRSQFEDVTAEAKSLAEQSKKQLQDVCDRANEVRAKLNKIPYSDFVKFGRFEHEYYDSPIYNNKSPEHKEFRANAHKFDVLQKEVYRIRENCTAVESIVEVATGLSKVFRKNTIIYDDTVKGITRQMKNQQQEAK